MSQLPGQVESAPRRCPRCGGLMVKPAGSSFYWHADYNHPRCEITNIIDPPLVQATEVDQSPSPQDIQPEPPKGKHQKK